MTTKEEKKNKFKNSISLKLIIVCCLSLVLLLPSLKIRQLIREREDRKEETIKEITQKWGTEQTISGPILIIPYVKRVHTSKNEYTDHIHYFHVLPSELSIDGTLQPSERYRGIYKVITYNTQLNMKGQFTPEDFINWPNQYTRILWEEARVVVGISDLKGITQNINLIWNSGSNKFSPGKFYASMFDSGINSEVVINKDSINTFSVDLALNGSEAIYFTPTAGSTEVTLTGNWHTPSFDGSFLPQAPQVNDTSFSAQWNVIEMNRNYPQIWSSKSYDQWYDYQSFGVKLLLPVDTYQKSERSVKYALLFIALTFLIVFFSEITGKNRVHPIQYLIIGISLIIFYSLLISLAEHIGFNAAYWVSSLVIIGLITYYIKSLLKNWKPTMAVTSTLVILYTFLFTLLQISDYALLLGNIGLVIILAVVMIFSRKVNWYAQRTITNDETDTTTDN